MCGGGGRRRRFREEACSYITGTERKQAEFQLRNARGTKKPEGHVNTVQTGQRRYKCQVVVKYVNKGVVHADSVDVTVF